MGKKTMKQTNPINDQLNRLGLTLKEIIGDGNCMFRAIADQLGDYTFKEIREKVCNYLEGHTEYANYLQEDYSKYCSRMRQDGVFGGNIELVSAANVFKIGICIHQLDSEVWHINSNSPDSQTRTIHLFYHDYEHYSSVRNIDGSLPNLNIEIPPTTVNTNSKLQKKRQNRNIDALVQKVLEQTNLPLTDELRIKKLFIEFKNDVNKVLDKIYDELENESPKKVIQSTQPPTDTHEKNVSNKQRKLSTRDKKELKRKEKRLKNKMRVNPAVNESKDLIDTIKALSI